MTHRTRAVSQNIADPSRMISYAPSCKAVSVEELLYYLGTATVEEIAKLTKALEVAHFDG